MALVTILTPTYNRAENLPALYASLKKQTSDNWLWLVVDDGSQDGTRDLISAWEREDSRVSCIFKKNGGKHTALNAGMEKITTPYVFIVDSDDTLLPEAVATVEAYDRRYAACRERLHLSGFSFLRIFSDGTVNGGAFAGDDVVSTYADQRINIGDTGDKAEVFQTDVLKKYPFPVFRKEKFLPEDAVWMKMSEDYEMIFANRKVYVCDYHEGGLTKSGRRMKLHSPLGMMYRSAVYLNNPQLKNRKVRLKMILLYQIYRHFAVRAYQIRTEDDFENEGIPKVPHDLYWYALKFPSFCLYVTWKHRYGEN